MKNRRLLPQEGGLGGAEPCLFDQAEEERQVYSVPFFGDQGGDGEAGKKMDFNENVLRYLSLCVKKIPEENSAMVVDKDG